MKDVSAGPPQVDINVPWGTLHSEWKKENYEAGKAAYDAVALAFRPDLAVAAAQVGGKKKNNKKIANTKKTNWVSLGRKVRTRSGELRTLYRNASTGEHRVKRFSTRAGKRVATFVTF